MATLARMRSPGVQQWLKSDVVASICESDVPDEPFTLWPTNAACMDPSLTGGKGSSLAVLNAARGVRVPPFFCVTTVGFKRALASSPEACACLRALEEFSAPQLNPPLRSSAQRAAHARELFELAGRMRTLIEDVQLSPDVCGSIARAYEQLCVQVSNITSPEERKDVAVAVRSSATGEDGKDASFAGQHDTLLHQRGAETVMHAVRICWRSAFTARAVEYRHRHGIPHSAAVMAVVVQCMVSPAVAGTGFSHELSTRFPAVHIAATYGLGEAVVSGEVTADEWLVERGTWRVIKRVLGSKRIEFRAKGARVSQGALSTGKVEESGVTSSDESEGKVKSTENGTESGVECVEVAEERRARYCLPSTTVQAVASCVVDIAGLYSALYGYGEVDTEFAVDGNGELFMLQSRPVVETARTEIQTISLKALKKDSLICTGSYSLLGAISGRAKVIQDFEELVAGNVTIESDDIVFAAKTANYWNQYLTSVRGIVTMEGSATAHPMLIGRERNLPVICGVPDLMRVMKRFDGCIVTMDGLTKKVYVGEHQLRTATADEIEGMFVPQEVPPLQEFASGMRFMEQWHRAVLLDDEWWTFNPNYEMSPAWREMVCASLACRVPLVNTCRTSDTCQPLVQDWIDNTARVIHGKCAQLTTERNFSRLQCLFDDFSIDDAEKFHSHCIECVEKYVNASCDFRCEKTPHAWREYTEQYRVLMAVLGLHYYWQLYLKRQSARAAHKLGMCKMHFESLLVRIQEETPEEDVRYRQLILKAALLLQRAGVGPISRPIDGQRLLEAVPGLSDSVHEMARSFRTKNATDIAEEIDGAVQVVLEKVVEAFEQGATALSNGHSAAALVEYYPDEEDSSLLLRWTRLSVESRCQKSDFHHARMVGQWKVRDALEQILNDGGFNLREVLQSASLEELSGHIESFQERRRPTLHAALRECFPVKEVPESLLELATRLHTRLQGGGDASGRQLMLEDADIVYPMLSQLAAYLPEWLERSGSEWPLRVGSIAGVSRIDVMQTPSFGVRLHRFDVGYVDVNPHNHNWSFFSVVLGGSYDHCVYHRAVNANGAGSLLLDRWSRPAKGAYNALPEERRVALNLQLAQRHAAGGRYFLHNDTIHGIGRVNEPVITIIIRSALATRGSSDTYSKTRPVWSNQKLWCDASEVGDMVRDWARLLRACDLPVSESFQGTKVQQAARNGDVATLKHLLAAGADTGAQHEHDGTALHVAARSGQQESVEVLLQYGASVDCPGKDGRTALHSASKAGHAGCVKVLLGAGAHVNATYKDQRSALHHCTYVDARDVMDLLINAGAHLDASTSDGLTPLHLAANGGHLHAVSLLLERGADMRSVDKKGRTALHFAVDGGRQHPQEQGCSSNQEQTQAGSSSTGGNVGEQRKCAVVALLLARGADPTALDSHGCTPLQYAERLYGNSSPLAHVLRAWASYSS